MSFDLSFYTSKGRRTDERAIAEYLSTNLVAPISTQWFFENEDTGVYYSFDLNEPNTDPESVEWYESFSEFENTRFSFNLNFIRPNFFGLEAFAFVEKFVNDLDLFVLNEQSAEPAAAKPRKETAESLYKNWSQTNLSLSAAYAEEFELFYYPLDRSNDVWRYNLRSRSFQEQLGDEYFVPTLVFARKGATGEVITLSTWTEHIPCTIPPADYFVIIRQRKKVVRTRRENGVLSHAYLMSNFGKYFDDCDLENCKIIHPEAATRVGTLFNTIEFEFPLKGFLKPVELEKITNAKRLK